MSLFCSYYLALSLYAINVISLPDCLELNELTPEIDMDQHFGLETFLRVEKDDIKCAVNDTTIILVHWCLANQGILCIGTGEQIPEGARR